MNPEDIKKYVEEYMSYLAMYDMEGNLRDAFLNLKIKNEHYIQQHQDILEGNADNVHLTFVDAADGCVVGALYPQMIDKVNLVVYSPYEFMNEHPEWFLED